MCICCSVVDDWKKSQPVFLMKSNFALAISISLSLVDKWYRLWGHQSWYDPTFECQGFHQLVSLERVDQSSPARPSPYETLSPSSYQPRPWQPKKQNRNILLERNSSSVAWHENGVYLGIRTCELFLCFVAIVRVRVCYVDFFVFFVLRHWWVSQVLTPRQSRNSAWFGGLENSKQNKTADTCSSITGLTCDQTNFSAIISFSS